MNTTPLEKKINPNVATAQEIAEFLPKLGEGTAKKIVEYREAHGAFGRIEDLRKVPGLGWKITEDNLGDYFVLDENGGQT